MHTKHGLMDLKASQAFMYLGLLAFSPKLHIHPHQLVIQRTCDLVSKTRYVRVYLSIVQ